MTYRVGEGDCTADGDFKIEFYNYKIKYCVGKIIIIGTRVYGKYSR